jgi:hypothetical protein
VQAWQPWDACAYRDSQTLARSLERRKEWDALSLRLHPPPLLRAMHDVLNLNPSERRRAPVGWTLIVVWLTLTARRDLRGGFF